MNFDRWQSVERTAHIRFSHKPQTPEEIAELERWLAVALDRKLEDVPPVARVLLDGWAGFKPTRNAAPVATEDYSSSLYDGPDRQTPAADIAARS